MLGLNIFVRIQTFWQRPFAPSRNFCHPAGDIPYPHQWCECVLPSTQKILEYTVLVASIQFRDQSELRRLIHTAPPRCHRWLRFPVLRSPPTIITPHQLRCFSSFLLYVIRFFFFGYLKKGSFLLSIVETKNSFLSSNSGKTTFIQL